MCAAPRAGVPVLAGAAAVQVVLVEWLPLDRVRWCAAAGILLNYSSNDGQSRVVADGSMEERLQQQRRRRSWSDRVRLVASKGMSELKQVRLEKEEQIHMRTQLYLAGTE
jgi:hypothetical protein